MPAAPMALDGAPPRRKPAVWPPAARTWELRPLMAAEERGHPALHTLHVAAAAAFCFLGGLSPAASSAGFAVLMAVWAVRLPGLWRFHAPLLRVPALWCAVGFVAWAALSGLWTPSPGEWLDQLGAMRVALVLPALWPVIGQARLLVVALALGVNLQNLFQLAQHFGVMAPQGGNAVRASGLHAHPGHVTTWCAVAMLLLASLLLEQRRSRQTGWLTALSLGLMSLGVLLAAGRGAILGLLLGGAATAGALLLFHARTALAAAKWPAAALALVIATGAAVWALGGWPGLDWQFDQLQRSPSPSDPIGQRFVWWQAAMELWREHPVRGGGLGSFAAQLADTSPVRQAIAESSDPHVASHLRAAHPHSIYLHAMVDLGLVGLALLLGMLLSGLAAAWRRARLDALSCGILGALVACCIAGQFETLLLNGVTGALLFLVLAFAVLPRLRSPTPDRAATIQG